jgi:hypothetical protein
LPAFGFSLITSSPSTLKLYVASKVVGSPATRCTRYVPFGIAIDHDCVPVTEMNVS